MSAWEGMLKSDAARPAHRTRRDESAGPHALHARVLHDGALGRESVRRGSRSVEHHATSSRLLELGQLKSPDANDAHIVNIVDWLLQYAFDQRASDIHIEPRRDKGHVRFRIDGVMHQRLRAAAGGERGRDEPSEDPRPHGRRRETPAAGRSREDEGPRRQRSRIAPVDAADRVRRKDGRADLRSRRTAAQFPGTRPRRRRQRSAGRRWSARATGSCSSRVRPAPARRRRCIRR